MARETRATRFLKSSGAAFSVQAYDYDPDAESIGLHAAAALGVEPGCMLKSLMVLVDGKPACAILPSDRELSMKRLAAALGGKHAEMMKVSDAERISGYKVGGVSPFGQPRRLPVAFEETALALALVFINGGQRGLQVRIAPGEAVRLLGAIVAPIAA